MKNYYLVVFSLGIFLSSAYLVGANDIKSMQFCIRESGGVFLINDEGKKRECHKRDALITFDSIGMAGPIGPMGATGAIGPQGVPGEPGEKGETGSLGPQGEKGDPGISGSDGERGERGEKGETGETGAIGPVGPAGEQGPIGEKGDPGERGETGSSGAIGPQGEPGEIGAPGRDGVSGYEMILGTPSTDDELIKIVTATCPEGKSIIGGGYRTLSVSNSSEVVITENFPLTTTTWQVRGGVDGATSSGDESFSLQAYALCVIVP